FMLDNLNVEEPLEELTAAVIMMARIQATDDTTENAPTYDAKTVSKVHTSHDDLRNSTTSRTVSDQMTLWNTRRGVE
ncbi:hypothetical protein Tco_0470274, partial [Tanacetum coccineum]